MRRKHLHFTKLSEKPADWLFEIPRILTAKSPGKATTTNRCNAAAAGVDVAALRFSAATSVFIYLCASSALFIHSERSQKSERVLAAAVFILYFYFLLCFADFLYLFFVFFFCCSLRYSCINFFRLAFRARLFVHISKHRNCLFLGLKHFICTTNNVQIFGRQLTTLK